MAHEILRSPGTDRTPACVVTLSVDTEIQYKITVGEEHQVLIRASAGSIDALVSFLESAAVRGADEARLAAASPAAAETQYLARYSAWSIRNAVRRWCHQAGVSSDWFLDDKRVSREHVLLKVPQPGTPRSITVSLTFSTRGKDSDHLTFTEEYRAPDEILGYSYATAISYAERPALTTFLEDELGVSPGERAGDAEDRLIGCFEKLIARGDLDLSAGQSAMCDQVRRWCSAAGRSSCTRGATSCGMRGWRSGCGSMSGTRSS